MSKGISYNAGVKKMLLAAMDGITDKCVCCKKPHIPYTCENIKQLSMNDRLQLVWERYIVIPIFLVRFNRQIRETRIQQKLKKKTFQQFVFKIVGYYWKVIGIC